MPLLHPLTIFDEHGLKNTTNRNLNCFHIANGLKLSWRCHHLFCLRQRQPGQAKGTTANQGPREGTGQETGLLQDHLFMAALHAALNRILSNPHQGARLTGASLGQKVKHQAASCWR